MSKSGPIRFRDFVPLYEPVKIETLTSSGTVIPGSAGHVIVIEYHVQQNLGTTTPTISLLNGTVPFQTHSLPEEQTFSFCAPTPGREWRMSPGTPFVVNLSTAGSVVTNTRYWYEEFPQ